MLGRIEGILNSRPLHPDSKNDVRMVDIKTTKREVVHRATSRLVPLLPEDSEEEPLLRRSKRMPTHTTALLTRVVLCWLALTTPLVKTLMIKPLSPGIHFERLGAASVKAFDLDFTLETSINVTENRATVDRHVNEFQDFCTQYKDGQYPQLYQHCQGLENNIRTEADIIQRGINGSYHKNREKRATSVILRAVAKGAIKYSTPGLVSAGLIYQAVENHQLENQISHIKGKITKVSRLMTNATDMEFVAVELQLDKLLAQQEQLRIAEQITKYSASIQLPD